MQGSTLDQLDKCVDEPYSLKFKSSLNKKLII